MNKPIGVFDSGLGGLTVVKRLRSLMPFRDIVYFGDTARVPYGGKSRESITRFSRQNCRFLLSRDVAAVVVACNTSSALALPALKDEFAIPLFDVISPGARRAVEITRRGKIGVIGTYATVNSGAYEREISALDGDLEVYSAPCPLFVPLAEEGWTDRPATLDIAREYLLPLRGREIDVLILGCTHYPVMRETIQLVAGDGVTLVDSGEGCAEAVLAGADRGVNQGEPGRLGCFVSDMPERFREIGRLFLGEEIGDLEVVDPAEYG